MSTATATKTNRCGAETKKGRSCKQPIGAAGICQYHGVRAVGGQHVEDITAEAEALAEQAALDPTADPVDVKALVRERTDALKHGIEQLMADPNGLPKLFENRAKFRRYSFNNQIMIWMQQPKATQVAPASVWAQMGRTPKEGEAPILIYTPRKYRKRKKDENGNFVKDADGKYEYEGREQVTFSLNGKVYDVSQTEGDPLPELPIDKLTGAAPEELKSHLDQVAADADIDVSYERISGGANGYYNPQTRKIVVEQNNEPAQQVKTLTHELGHAFDPELDIANYSMSTRCRGDAEAVAEATAHIVGHRFGFQTESYSTGYIASWVNGDPKRLEQVMSRTEAAVSKILPPTPTEAAFTEAQTKARAEQKKKRAAKAAAKKK